MLHINKLPAWNLLFFYFPVSIQKLRAGYCPHGGSPSPTNGATLCFPHILVMMQVRVFLEQKYCRAGQATDENMVHAHCMLITYGYTHSDYVILIAFPLQQWLHEHTSLLYYMYIAFIFNYSCLYSKIIH